jgi:predicted RNA-binding Zn ribbon-like protein
MIKVTWEWLGQGLALDLADTVTVEDGVENDLIRSARDYERWAELEGAFLPGRYRPTLHRSRRELLALRTELRAALGAVTAGGALPKSAVDRLNAASRAAPAWTELDPSDALIVQRTSASRTEEILALYARSAMELLAAQGDQLRRCPAPSCGMFYVSRRRQQRWCSTQCGSRARVARHYERRRAPMAAIRDS